MVTDARRPGQVRVLSLCAVRIAGGDIAGTCRSAGERSHPVRLARRRRNRLESLNARDFHSRAKFPDAVSCVKVRGCEGYDVPGGLRQEEAPSMPCRSEAAASLASVPSSNRTSLLCAHGGQPGRRDNVATQRFRRACIGVDDVTMPNAARSRRPRNRRGVSPVLTIQAPVAQLDRVLASEAKGHRFESCRARHLRASRTGAVCLREYGSGKTVG